MLVIRLIACLTASIAGFWVGWHLSHRYKKMPRLSLGLGFIIGFVVFGQRALPANWALRWEEFSYASIGGPVLLAICIPIVGIQAADAISNRLLRLFVLAVVAVALFQQIWIGLLDSLIAVPELSRLKTHFASAGICMQTTGYTCGPAAAVTALARLGYQAQESSIALASETGRYYGADEFRLAQAMNQTAKGLHCHVADFRSVDDLRGLPPVIVIINLGADIAHYIVILKFDGKWAECADPMAGHIRKPREMLERDWTGRGIICDRW